MKIAGTVILYNPNVDVLENIQTYLIFIEKLYVIDNSTKEYSFIVDIKNNRKVKYISMNGNKGIAKALKVATEIAIVDGFDFLLSMDQDSKFPTNDFKYIEDYLHNQNIDDLGIIGVNFGTEINFKIDNKSEVIDVYDTITSGSFMYLKNYSNIAGYNEDLFIDSVDHDICYQFKEKKFRILMFPNIYLLHKLGEKKKINFLFYKREISTHTPLRYYYMYRNSTYLSRNRSKYYNKMFAERKKSYCLKYTLRRILFEKPRLKILKMILRGISDGKKGILGPYKERKNKWKF